MTMNQRQSSSDWKFLILKIKISSLYNANKLLKFNVNL